jgi:SNF2 family DNA or RNA helicase
MNQQYEALESALLTLDENCDGARTRDGIGFNGTDTQFGRSLASQIRDGKTLSIRQQESAISIVQKYRATQLQDVSRTLATTETYRAYTEEATPVFYQDITVSESGDNLVVRFTDTETRAERTKEIQNLGVDAEFDFVNYTWIVGVEHREAIMEMATVASPETPIALDYQNRVVTATIAKLPNTLHEEQSRIIKEILSARMDYRGLQWEVARRDAPRLLELFPDATVTSRFTRMITDENHRVAREEEARAREREQQEAMEKSRRYYNANKPFGDVETHHIVPEGKKLFPYQEAFLEYMEVVNGRAITADDMGLGKTIMAAMWLSAHPELRPAVIVCPPGLITNWKKELEAWLPKSKENYTFVLSGRFSLPLLTQYFGIFLISHSVLKSWEKEIIKADTKCLIVDEAHSMKNMNSVRTKSFHRVAKTCKSVIVATGTPVQNNVGELFPLLHAVDSDRWPSYPSYMREYADIYSDTTSLNRDIQPYVIRRTKDMVLKQLPDRRRIPVFVDMSERGRSHYDKVIDSVVREIAKEADMGIFNRGNHLKLMSAAMKAAGAGMLDSITEWIDAFTESRPGEKLVVFSHHRFVVDVMMERYGDKAVRLTGKELSEKQDDAVWKFQNDKNTTLLFGTILAANKGWTMTAAKTTLTVQMWWNPKAHDQAESRIHRIGQEEDVTNYYLLASKTIMEQMFAICDEKLEASNVALGESMEGFQGQETMLEQVIEQMMRDAGVTISLASGDGYEFSEEI